MKSNTRFDKLQIQKVALSGLLIVGLLYCYFNFLLKPMNTKEASALTELEALRPEITAAKSQIRRTEALKTDSPRAADTFAAVSALIPEGAPVAWFPPRVSDFLKQQGIDRTSVRLSTEGDIQPVLASGGFRRLNWQVDIPAVGFVPLGIAIAGLENNDPLLRIDSFQIDLTNNDPEKQHVTLRISTLVKK